LTFTCLCGAPYLFAGDRAEPAGSRACENPCTILVPQVVLERRTVDVTEYRTEICERPVTIQKFVPETRTVRDLHVEMVTEVERRVETCVDYIPVWREVEREVRVLVPTVEKRTGTRRVCRRVQIEELCPQTVDRGEWVEVVDGDCVQRVWKPELVTEQVPVLVWRNVIVDEPYEYSAVVHRPETRTIQVRVCGYVKQERQREFEVTTCVPRGRELVRNVSTYRTEKEQGVEQIPVLVPYTVQKEIDVPVCRLVPQK
jgi:hypothetical protein